jgi:hypothetical protein
MRIFASCSVMVCSVLMIGCASSGPVPMGMDTYMLTKQSSTGFHSAGSVKADIYKEANQHCQSLGRQFQPVQDRGVDGMPGRSFANAEVMYRCLPQGDSEIGRPTVKPLPSATIEVK